MTRDIFGKQGFIAGGSPPADSFEILILTAISIALGGVTIWFSERTTEAVAEKLTKLTGKLFLFSALYFTVMALIAPILPELKDTIAWWGTGVRYIMGIKIIPMISTFAISLCAGIAFIWETEKLCSDEWVGKTGQN